MTYQGFSYHPPKESGALRIVAITSVDPAARKAAGITRERTTIEINCSFPVGGMIVTPAVGEQWYVQRQSMQYILHSRLPANSKELLVEAQEGQVQVGSSGPLTLHGSEVQVENHLRLGTTLYRDNSGTLESSADGQTWTVIQGSGGNGGGSGAVSSVAGKIGDITLEPADIAGLTTTLATKADLVSGTVPDSQIKHRVLQYATRSAFPTTGAASTLYLDAEKKEVYAWVGGAYAVISSAAAAAATILGSGAGPLDLSAFFAGFTLSGGTLIDQIINTLNTLTGGGLNDLGSVLSGLGNITTSIVQAITGAVGGTISTLTDFFSGFATFTGVNGLIKQFVSALSGGILSGGLAELTTHFGGLVSGAGTLLQQIIKNITGFNLNLASLGNLQTFFGNLRNFLGNIDFLNDFTLGAAAEKFVNSVLKQTGIFAVLGDLQSWLTGITGGSLQIFFTNLRNFLGGVINPTNFLNAAFNINTAAQKFITDVLNPQNLLANLASLQAWLTGVVGGSLELFFTNLRKLLGAFGTNSINLLDTGFNPLTAAAKFINDVLAKSTGVFNIGNIPQLDMSKISDLAAELLKYTKIDALVQAITGTAGIAVSQIGDFFSGIVTGSPGTLIKKFVYAITGAEGPLADLTTFFGTAGKLLENFVKQIFTAITGRSTGGITDLTTFFTNLRSFLGIDFLPTLSGLPVSFDPTAALTGFLNTLRSRGATVVSDLTDWFTKDGSANAIQIFFTNLRKLLGNSLFDPLLSFNPAHALNTLIAAINSSATGLLNLNRLVPISIADIGTGINSLTNVLLGKTDISALVQKITGQVGNSLDLIGDFFSGFVTGTPGTLIKKIVQAVTGSEGPLSDLATFFGDTGKLLESFVKQIFTAVTGVTTGSLARLTTFFTNLRSFLGIDFLPTLSGLPVSFSPTEALNSFLSNLRTQGALIFTDLTDWFTKDAPVGSTNVIQIFFTNLRKVFGKALFDPLTTFSPANVVNTLISTINNSASTLLNLNRLVPIAIADIGSGANSLLAALGLKTDIATLVQKITGIAGAVDLTHIGSFFSGFATFDPLAPNGLLAQFTDALMGAASSLTGLKTFFSGFDAFTGANSLLKQIGSAVSGNSITATTLQSVRDAFSNLRTFLGNPDFANKTLAENLNKFIDLLLPMGRITAIADLASYLGGTALADIEKFFKNLASLFGVLNLRTTLPSTFNAQAAGAQFLNNIFSQGGITTLIPTLTSAKIAGLVDELAAKAGIAALVQNITGLTNGTLGNLGTFFSGLPDAFSASNAATTFIQQLVKQITGTAGPITGIFNFFSNLRSFLGNPATLLGATGSFVPADVVGTFLTSVLAPVNNTLKKFAPLTNSGTLDLSFVKNFTTDFIDDIVVWSNTNITAPIVSTLTGLADLTDLGNLGDWARSLLGRLDPIPASNLVGNIASSLLGIIPVSHIAPTSPNLLSQGAFNAVTTVEEGDGWSWDETTVDATGDVGAAKVAITSAKLREMFSSQEVPVVAGDKLTLTGYIKTSGFTGRSTHTITLGGATGGSFRLTYENITSAAIAYNATAATVQTALGQISTIGSANVTVTGTAAAGFAVTITGTASKLTGTSSLTGGTLTVTSTGPLALTLLPFVGENQYTVNGNPVTVTAATAGASTAWTQLTGGTYTVPDTVTSVLVRLAVSDQATAGTVWWSDLSLIKTGALRQSLVEKLTDAWNHFWNGIFGTSRTDKTVDDLLIAAGAISSAAGTADANGKTAIARVQDLVTSLLNAPATAIGNIATVLMDGVGNTIQNFLDFLNHVFGRKQPGIDVTTGNTVNDLVASAYTLADKAFVAVENTDTLTTFFNEPRQLPAWVGALSDDVSYPHYLINNSASTIFGSGTTTTQDRLILIPVVATSQRAYDAIKFGCTAVTATSVKIALYDVDESTGLATKVVDLGNRVSDITSQSTTIKTITLPDPKTVQTGEVYYIGILANGGTITLSYSSTISGTQLVDYGRYPRFLASYASSGTFSVLPATVLNSQISSDGTFRPFWGALGLSTPSVIPAKLKYNDGFNRTDSSTLGGNWVKRYGNGLAVVSSKAQANSTTGTSINTYVNRLNWLDQKVQATFSRGGYYSAAAMILMLRGDSNGKFAYLRVTQSLGSAFEPMNVTARIYTASSYSQPGTQFNGGTARSSLYSSNIGINYGPTDQVWRFEAIGNAYYGYLNNTLMVSWTDSGSSAYPVTDSFKEVGVGGGYITGTGTGTPYTLIDDWSANDI